MTATQTPPTTGPYSDAAADALQAYQAMRAAITALINLEDELLDHNRDFIAHEVLDIKTAACDLLGRLRVVYSMI
jgi:hypothetical protein